MRLGLIARADRTGLGHQTWEVYRHLRPAVTVVVDMTGHGPQRSELNPSWYPDGSVIRWGKDGSLPGAFEALRRCDVVYTAESFYDPTLSIRLRSVGVPTVRHVNPELDDGATASATWFPTSWLVPEGATVIPMPAPVDRYPEVIPVRQPWRAVHPSSIAIYDRNGRRAAQQALRGRLSVIGPPGAEVSEYWGRDPGFACSVIPRRYGGLCLPALEALSAGVPVVMPDCPPNHEWPIIPVPAHRGPAQRMKAGMIQTYDVRPEDILRAVTGLVGEPERLEMERKRARDWAEAHSWEAMGPLWLAKLEAAAQT